MDLYVVVERSDERSLRRMSRASGCLWGVPFATDVLVVTRDVYERRRTVPAGFEHQIHTEGRILYERKKP